MNETERVYVVVDSGLSRGVQAAQSIHAVAALQDKHPLWFLSWINGGNTIIVLESDEIDLLSHSTQILATAFSVD